MHKYLAAALESTAVTKLNINHTLKNNFSRHTDKAVFKVEHLLGITAKDSLLITTVSLLPNLNLTIDSFTDFQFCIIEILKDLALVDEPAKSVGTMAFRIVEMIPNEVGVICFALLGQSGGVEVYNGHCVGVKST